MVCERPPRSLRSRLPSRVSPANPVGRPHDSKEEGESKTKDLRSFFLERGRLAFILPLRGGEPPKAAGGRSHTMEFGVGQHALTPGPHSAAAARLNKDTAFAATSLSLLSSPQTAIRFLTYATYNSDTGSTSMMIRVGLILFSSIYPCNRSNISRRAERDTDLINS